MFEGLELGDENLRRKKSLEQEFEMPEVSNGCSLEVCKYLKVSKKSFFETPSACFHFCFEDRPTTFANKIS